MTGFGGTQPAAARCATSPSTATSSSWPSAAPRADAGRPDARAGGDRRRSTYRRHRRARRRVRARRRRAVRRDVHDRAVAGHRRLGDGEPPLRRRATSTCAPSPTRCAREYRAIVDRGLLLQIDAPDLAMERHTLFADRPLDEFLELGRARGRRDQRRARTASTPRACASTCAGATTRARTPTTSPSTSSSRCCTRPTSARSWCRWPTPATPTSTTASSGTRCPTHMVLVAGVIDTTSNYVEHPEVVADRLATRRPVGRRPAPGHRRHRLRVRHLGGHRRRRAVGRVGEARRAARRRRPRVRATAVIAVLVAPACGNRHRDATRTTGAAPP